jgi:ribosome biogenesis GTPase
VRHFDHKGRCTTPHRELVVLPGGGLLIDTPGMRELQLWESEEGVKETSEEIERLARACRFRNCGHRSEPDSAVRAPLESGALDPDRFGNYQKLQGETHSRNSLNSRFDRRRRRRGSSPPRRNS